MTNVEEIFKERDRQSRQRKDATKNWPIKMIKYFGCRFTKRNSYEFLPPAKIFFSRVEGQNIVDKWTASAVSHEFACKFSVNVRFRFVEEAYAYCKGLSFMYLNIGSLSKHFESLNHFLGTLMV